MTEEIKQRIEQIQHGNMPEGYKRTKFGIVPSEWEEKRISDVLRQRKTLMCISEDVSLLSFTIAEGIIEPEDKKSNKRDFLIKDMATKKFALTEVGDIIYNPANLKFGAIHRNNLRKGLVSPIYGIFYGAHNSFYLGYLLRTQRFIDYAKVYAEGTVEKLKTLGADSFLKLKITLPSYAEQEKIVEILSAQDTIITLKEKLIKEKEKQKTILMQQLITGKQRLPGFSEKWEKIKFSNCFDFLSGYPFSSAYFNQETGARIIRNRDLKCNDQIVYTTELCPSEYHIKDGDILVGMDGEFVPCIWKKGNALLNQRVGKIIVSDKYDEKFIYYALFDPLQSLQDSKGATTVKHLASKDFEKMYCLAPRDHREQIAIGSILSAADYEIDLLYKSLEQERYRKKALMQLLLTGIVRVNV